MIKVTSDRDLGGLNSFGIPARARRMVEFGDASELAEWLAGNPEILQDKWNVMGGGNNILFTRDYDGTLLRPATEEISLTGEDAASVKVRVSAGHDWDRFVEWCVGRGLWGAENLSHIPSLTGAAPVQNIGAYGAEVKDIVESVEMLDAATLKVTTLAGEHCGFGYRDSVFKRDLKGRAIITAVNFRLGRNPAPNTSYGALREEVERLGGETLGNIRQAVANIRAAKLPDPKDIGNAGSFFKNPVVPAALADELSARHPEMPRYPGDRPGTAKLSAGWLIEKAGWKGRREGNVGVYDKQALILVNHGGATGREISEFSARVRATVRGMSGIELEPEVNIW